jgi:hypothetical protein
MLFNKPQYLLIDGNNHVIVADSRNERAVLLKSDLQLKRVLLPTLHEQPGRLFLSKLSGLMLISKYNSSSIEICQVFSSISEVH